MKKYLQVFILASLLKGILLYLLILSLPTLTYLVFFIILCIIDWKVMTIVSNDLKDVRWYKLIVFTFCTFVMVLWITGPLFSLHNLIFKINPKGDASIPLSTLFVFLFIGLVFSTLTTFIWLKRNNKKLPAIE